MATPFELRRALPADAPALWTIRTDAIRVGCEGLYSPEQIAAWTSVPMPDGFLAAIGACVFLVAVAEHEAAGFAFMTPSTSTLDGIFGAPRRHRRGVGRLLLGELERHAANTGVASLRLSSTLNAEPFYASHGYRVVERTSWMHPNGFELPSVTMEKQLG